MIENSFNSTKFCTRFTIVNWDQCDHKNIAKCLYKLPKNDFTRKMIDFDNFTKIA